VLERLQVAEARAKADEKGVWAEGVGQVECSYEVQDAKSLVETHKGNPVDGVVEKVLSGDRLIVRLLLTPEKHVQTMVLIAGIKAPSTKRNAPDGQEQQPAEPFGEEAQAFLETRLLQRDVTLDLLGVSPQGQLVATVKHPTQGSIAPHVLKAGLARCTDFHSALLGTEMPSLRIAEQDAKDNKRGLYHAHKGAAAGGAGEFDAAVARIISADTLILRNKVGTERRISLSSVRQPKPSDPKQQPFVAEAREFLRKKIIGKHVKCRVDGKRAATEGYEEREMGTVTQGGKNIALGLVENGFCSVIRHRQDDSDRSPIYDELLQAEALAQQEQKGIWSSKAPSAKKYIDYSESAEKAKRQLAVIARQKKIPAVVDYVKAGSRFTVLIPRDEAKITLVLAGVRAPRSARNANEKSEPFGQEAHDFANRRCLQRDVEVDIDDIDKVGGFIGSLFVGRENFAKLLLEEGLASVNAYSAEKTGHGAELFAAEQKAKDARKGIWENYDPAAEAEAAEASVGASAPSNGTNGTKKDDYRDVVITHIDASGHLKLQQIGTGTTSLDKLMGQFRSFHITNRPALTAAPKVGDVVAAKFSADGEWYRAKVRRNDRDAKKSEVTYVDYGNSETIPWASLRALSAPNASTDFSLQGLKAQATDATLSYVQLPGSAEYLSDAIAHLAEQTDGRTLVARVDHIDSASNTLCVTLFDPDRSQTVEESLNADLVAEGWALVPRKLKAWEVRGDDGKKVLESLKKTEDGAKAERRGMWEYGDISADD
jgi:staphylococcal nuclease domain-containing protein 1